MEFLLKYLIAACPLIDSNHYIRIINVENDEKVNSYIEENLRSFKEKGFETIYGLRTAIREIREKLRLTKRKWMHTIRRFKRLGM